VHAQRDARGRRPIMRRTLLLVAVSRLPQQTRDPQALWWWWHTPDDGDSIPNLDRAWRAYVRRFDVEQMFRFLKQTLNWTLPRVRHPAQADRWTWLVTLADTQLRLARPLADDRPLPWPRPQSAGKLTPERVRRGLSTLLLRLPILASAPGLRAKTLWTLTRASQRQALGSCDALPGHHQGAPGCHSDRLNLTTPLPNSRR
jgi:hypothetical protein